jgi:hypothetical protein
MRSESLKMAYTAGAAGETKTAELQLAAMLFVPAESEALACEVRRISSEGAVLACPNPPPLHSFVMMYIDGFGRFSGVATRCANGLLDIEFICDDEKRSSIARDVGKYLQSGSLPDARKRRHDREPAAGKGHLVRASGAQVACSALDISLQGLSLKVDVRPPVGEIISIGDTKGRVVRHHKDGIAVQFLFLAAG